MMKATVFLVAVASLVSSSTTAGTQANSFALTDTGCSAPISEGGWGYCGPDSCKYRYTTCTTSEGGGPATVDGVTGEFWAEKFSSCNPFLDRTTDADVTDWTVKGACTQCTQQTTGVCSAAFLEKILVGDGVKSAFCNDQFLVITSSGVPSLFEPNLNDIPNPPGKSGTSYVTGDATMDVTRPNTLYYPLNPTLLSESTGENNIGYYDVQTGAGAYSYLINSEGEKYGLPSDAGIGMMVNGGDTFPVYNNNAGYTPEKCEVDSCNEHVGQGGGQPHFHGDPYGDQNPTTCLYGPSNYTSDSVHPPIIGFSFDGILIYGRYLSDSAPGFNSPALDECGGHVHAEDDYDEHGFSLRNYHYHTQVFDGTCAEGAVCETGEKYVVSTTGPFRCFKADLGSVSGSSALLAATTSSSYLGKKSMEYHCCGMTDYYLLTGVNFQKPADSVDTSTTCTAPDAPANGAYTGVCATAGATLYSGWQCTLECNSGYTVSGTTKCVAGQLEEATCSSGFRVASSSSEESAESVTGCQDAGGNSCNPNRRRLLFGGVVQMEKDPECVCP